MFRLKHALVALLFCGLVAGNLDWIAPTASHDCYAKGGRSSGGRSSFGRSRPSSRPKSRPSKPSSRPSRRPSTKPSSKPSAKPSSSKYDTKAADASKKQQSRAIYKPQTPKSSYTTKTGQTVKVDSKAKSTQSVRKLSSEQYRTRSTRIEHHYHNTYGNRYDYYRNQPYVYVGGGYSPLFWYCMMDWSMERRARWMYHNQHTMDQALYQQELAKNAQLQAEIARLQGSVAVNSDYVDSEFKGQEDMMYSDEFVNAAYNPSVTAPAQSRVGQYLMVLGVIVLVAIFIYIVFIHSWKTSVTQKRE